LTGKSLCRVPWNRKPSSSSTSFVYVRKERYCR